MKKVLLTLGILFICATGLMAFTKPIFVGSMKSNKYHYSTCVMAKRIYPKNLIVFENPESAIKMGYSPCRICKPPLTMEKER